MHFYIAVKYTPMKCLIFIELLKFQDFMATVCDQSSEAAMPVYATPKKQQPVISCRNTEDDLKSGIFEYITEDSKAPNLFTFILHVHVVHV